MQELCIKRAARILWHGGVIAYPTEAVWGLGCDPDNQDACLELLQIKKRPVEKGMILIAADLDQIEDLLAPLTQEQQHQLAETWGAQHINGAVTFLVPDVNNLVPAWVKGEHTAVALRVSQHPVVRALCHAFGGPLVSTSANLAGRPPARSRLAVEKNLGRQLDFVVPGELGGQKNPSRIIDLQTGRTLRAA